MSTRTSLTRTAGVAASATFTLSGAAGNLEAVTIGQRVYIFMTTLVAGVVNQVLIGATAAASLDNLKSAVNRSAGEGSTYGSGTVAHEDVEATTNTDTTQLFVARAPGAWGNALLSVEGMANGAFGGAVFAGGVSETDVLSKTAAATGPDVDVAAFSSAAEKAGWVIELLILSLTGVGANPRARFAILDTVDNWSASIVGPSFNVEGPIGGDGVKLSIPHRDFPSLRIGVTSAELRCNLVEISSGETVEYSAFLVTP